MTTNVVRTRASALAFILWAASCVHEQRYIAGFDPMPGPTHPGAVQHATKRHRVWVSPFTAVWGGDVSLPGQKTSVAREAAQVVEQRLAASPHIVLDDPPSERAGEWKIVGALEGTTRAVRAVVLHLVAADGTEVASARSEMSAEPGLDRGALERAADEIERTISELPWTTTVSEVSERLLVTSAGKESGLTVNELLFVRKGGAWQREGKQIVHDPGVEVARVYVDALLERDGRPAGAYCRLWGGSFSGFDPSELSVEEP